MIVLVESFYIIGYIGLILVKNRGDLLDVMLMLRGIGLILILFVIGCYV